MRTLPASLLIAAALLLAACGSSSDSKKTTGSAPAGGSGETISISADPGGAKKFDKTSLSAKAGKVTIAMANPSQLPHAVEVEGNGVEGKGAVVTKGGSSKVSLDLKAGTYDFYCPVGDHRSAGMEGKLVVK